MERIILLLLTIVFTLEDLPKCPIYDCNLEGEQCAKLNITKDKITFHLKPCKNNQFCNIEFNKIPSLCSGSITIPTRYPGEYCKYNAECLAGKCIQNKCYPKDYEHNKTYPCKDDVDCNPGLYCINASCKKAMRLNDTCDENKKCSVPFVCNEFVNKSSNKTGKRCINMGTIKVGEKANTPAACESFYIKNGLCQERVKLIDGIDTPILCNETYDKCYYEDDTYTSCECGLDKKGNSYCIPVRNSNHMKKYFEYARSLSPDTCHISKGVLCQNLPFNKMGLQYYNAYVEHTNFTMWNTVYNNSECVKNMLNADYHYALQTIIRPKEPNDYTMIFWIAFISITGVLTLIIFIRYLCNSENCCTKTSRISEKEELIKEPS